jgi:hypothetical protein
MRIDCGWVSSKLENYFTDQLDAEQARLLAQHLESCEACNREIQSLHSVDDVVRQLFRRRLSVAQSSQRARRRVVLPLALSGAGLALASILMFAVWTHQRGAPATTPIAIVPPPAPQAIQQASEATPPDEPKTPPANQTDRTKPALTNPVPSNRRPDVPVSPDAPAFAVTDPAGYSRTLDDYRGSIVLFGRWSAKQPETAKNLERLYQAFGGNARIRLFGVPSRREDRLTGTSFPNMFNNGSQLLGARNGQFVLVDATGKTRLRGSLTGDGESLVTQVRAQLEQLGVK